MGNRRWNCHRKFVGQSPGHAVDLLQEFGVAALLDCYFRKSLRPAKISDDTPHPTLSRKGRGNLPSPRRRGNLWLGYAALRSASRLKPANRALHRSAATPTHDVGERK